MGGRSRTGRISARYPPEALEAVYENALPLRYYVDTEDTATLTSRFEEDPALVQEALKLALRYFRVPLKVVRLCLDQNPDAAKTVHSVELMYLLHRVPEDELLDMFRWLLEAGMTPNDTNWMRVSPLHLLALRRTSHGTDGQDYALHLKTMQLFIEFGADLEARDEEFRSTPLAWAARWGRKEAVELLLERGSRTNLPDDPPWATPLAWARKKGHAQIEAMLRQAGAKS